MTVFTVGRTRQPKQPSLHIRAVGERSVTFSIVTFPSTAVRFRQVDDDEEQWDACFASSQDVLALLAAEALADFDAGRTEPLDPNRL